VKGKAWVRPSLDAISVALGLLLAYNYRFHLDPIPIPGTEPPTVGHYLAAMPVLVAVFLVTFALSGIYRTQRGRALLDEIFSIIGATVVSGLVALALMSLYRSFSYSRLVLLYTIVAAFVLIAINRAILRQIRLAQQRRGIGMDRVLIVGTGTGSELLIQRMTMFPGYGYQVCGILDDRLEPGSSFAGARVIGRLAELPDRVRDAHADQVFIALPGADHETLLHLIKTCEDLQVEFRMLPDLFEIITTRVSADVIDGIPLVGVRRSQVTGLGLLLKRTFDLVVSLVLLVVLSPVMLILAIVIKLTSPGPVFYRQERVGREGRLFTVLKFRSMIADAEAATGPVFTAKDDTRRTPVGRFMRRFSLDELPQLINIIRGEMSLVGPRPERPFFVERFSSEIPRYLERHQVRPGVTGWAQVNDLRGDTSIANRTIYDIYYIENWSLVLDVKILLLTFGRVFIHHHAY
jgi:exopolysaccharide biosynthesis polyprenyl glycosylphosphotransferase